MFSCSHSEYSQYALYNTIILIFDIALLTKVASSSEVPHASAAQKQLYCRAIVREGLAQGPYAAAWGGFEPATLRLQGTEHTPTPPRPTLLNRAACIVKCRLDVAYTYFIIAIVWARSCSFVNELIGLDPSPPLPIWMGTTPFQVSV